MKLRWAALIAVLASSALMPRMVSAQSGSQPPVQRRNGSVGQNYPNPFNPDTRWSFYVGDPSSCKGERHRVTMRVYNLLAQVVAVPQLQGGSSSVSGGAAIENIELECGAYVAYWNGKYLNTTREAASGVYLYRLEVDGRTASTGRMFYEK
ncbi:MAG: hypothetical protein JO180_01370 [Gemmatirosa sp.]|nr:hypothetical protein [Gemmatirosa sp.]